MTKALLNEAQVASVKELHKEGWSSARLAERFEVSVGTIRRALNPASAEQDRNRKRYGRDNPRKGETAGRISSSALKLDGDARLAEIPADSRTMTQRLCGDPPASDPRRHWCPWLNRGSA